tara:strand:+ start:952 stop:1770 length:819 start_codon:yes stop_codon:yes gene_type:complete
MLYRKNFRSFVKSKNFSNIFLSFLFILSFLLIIFNKADYIVVNKIKSLSADVVVPITKIITSPVKFTSESINKINQIRYLDNENARLREEIIRLKKWQTLAMQNLRENNAYKKLLNSTSAKLSIVKTASVISQSSGIYSKSLTINAGKQEGLIEDQVIINERGLIGKVIGVSKNNSSILLITDQHSSVPVKTLNGDFYAIIKGSPDGKFLISSFIKDNKYPKIGDLLITSGNTHSFPKDILVGKVISINKDNFFALPYVDFNSLEFVQVIKK